MALGLASFVGLAIGLGIYLTPTIIAVMRRPVNMTAAIIVNVFLGWSLIGWIVSLVLALGPQHRYPQPSSYNHPGPYQPGAYPAPGAYHQGYGAPPQHQHTWPPAQLPQQPAWGTPGSQPDGGYAPEVSDAPAPGGGAYGSTQPYGSTPPPA